MTALIVCPENSQGFDWLEAPLQGAATPDEFMRNVRQCKRGVMVAVDEVRSTSGGAVGGSGGHHEGLLANSSAYLKAP